MIRRGIWTREQYVGLKSSDRRRAGGSVAFNLLLTSSPPTAQEILDFEDISFTLRMGNGTFRTTFRHRFDDLNAAINELLMGRFPQSMPLRVEDRAVSHGLTSWEWALALREKFPNVEVLASDLLLFLVELRLPDGTIFIAEPNGQALQYIKAPYVVSLSDPESWRYPVNRWIAHRARRRFASLKLPAAWVDGACPYPTRRIPYIHPEAYALSQVGKTLSFLPQSVFDRAEKPCQVVRTMNILNRSYFSEELLRQASRTIAESLAPDGIWIVGRTMEDNFVNHASIFELRPTGWHLLERLNEGSEIEALILATPPAIS